MPLIRLAITGFPHAMASKTDVGQSSSHSEEGYDTSSSQHAIPLTQLHNYFPSFMTTFTTLNECGGSTALKVSSLHSTESRCG
jgi:hypothetical protein